MHAIENVATGTHSPQVYSKATDAKRLEVVHLLHLMQSPHVVQYNGRKSGNRCSKATDAQRLQVVQLLHHALLIQSALEKSSSEAYNGHACM